jgi:pilus assembly protein CpaB
MNNKALTLSLVMAVLAVFFVQSYVSSIEEESKKKFGAEVLVVTAKRDIKEMETINETMIKYEVKPKRFIEPAAISFDKKEEDKDTAASLKHLINYVATVPIKAGEQITYNKLSEPGIRTGLAPQITPGKRGLSIAVTDITGVSKLIKPGDRVDVIAVLDLGGGKENKLVKTLLQDVVVLATGRNVNNNVPRLVEEEGAGREKVRSLAEDYNFTSITLEVDSMQAQVMTLVQANGENALSVSLRNNDDTDRAALPALTFGDVLGPDINRIQRGVAGRR